VAQETKFGTLVIEYDDDVLAPRPATVLQAEWAAELLRQRPEATVLELGAGAGQIGLLTLALSLSPSRSHRLIAVDESAKACRWVRHNAATAGLDHLVEVRESSVPEALAPEERFGVVIADPPWVPSGEVDRYPDDPPSAIDGGPDGLDVARAWVRTAVDHLAPDAVLLVQLGTPAQADVLGAEVEGLRLAEVREGAQHVVALLIPVG
jgi:release factor glutamine methyltransferase